MTTILVMRKNIAAMFNLFATHAIKKGHGHAESAGRVHRGADKLVSGCWATSTGGGTREQTNTKRQSVWPTKENQVGHLGKNSLPVIERGLGQHTKGKSYLNKLAIKSAPQILGANVPKKLKERLANHILAQSVPLKLKPECQKLGNCGGHANAQIEGT